jgi:hypothetical protein
MKNLLTAENIATALLLLLLFVIFIRLFIAAYRAIKDAERRSNISPIILLSITIAFTACNKSEQLKQEDKATKDYYYVSLIGKDGDTTFLPAKRARVETTGLDSAFDNRLKLVLLGYDGHGTFTVSATNLSTCQGILRWNWDGNFKIDSIGYPSNDPLDPKNDVLVAGETKIFTLYAQPKVGRLKLQLKGTCGNSSELIIDITTTILPIVYANYTITYKDGRNYINFDVEHPEQLSLIVVEKQVGQGRQLLFTVPGGEDQKHYSIPLPIKK